MLPVAGHRLVDELRQVAAALDGGIVDKMQLRHDAQLDAARQLLAQETTGAFQALQRLGVFAVQAREKNLGMGIIAGHFDAGDGHQAHARIIDFEAHQLGYFALDLLGNAISSCKIRQRFLLSETV